jgi:hypothetical protein
MLVTWVSFGLEKGANPFGLHEFRSERHPMSESEFYSVNIAMALYG